MRAEFPIHDFESAPGTSCKVLEEVEADFGMIPNLERVLASSPEALTAYATLWDLFNQCSLSDVEKQVVYQTANFENNCTYCVPWHTLLSRNAGMSEENVEALRSGRPLRDERLEALRVFTRSLIEFRGHPGDEAMDKFLAAGFEPGQALEVILGLATKLISNFTNGIAHTPLDSQIQSLEWSKPGDSTGSESL